jgi:hypothetical protein
MDAGIPSTDAGETETGAAESGEAEEPAQEEPSLAGRTARSHVRL